MKRRHRVHLLVSIALSLAFGLPEAAADVELATIFGSGMVLQRGIRAPFWGRAAPGERVTVEVAGQSHATEAGPNGAWRVELDPLEASNDPLTVTVRGANTIVLEDVLVGEVWLCSGQSNMVLPVDFAEESDVERLNSEYPRLRMIKVAPVATDQPQTSFVGKWEPSWPSTAGRFSAVCFFFGRELHQILAVPVGLIQSAQSNSSCQSWISRQTLEADPRFAELLRPAEQEKAGPPKPAGKQNPWKEALKAARSGEGQPPANPAMQVVRGPSSIFNGYLHPIIGYGIRGVLWYQGESNVGDPDLYGALFPTMIRDWRRRWGRDDLPFYWIQLPAFGQLDKVTSGKAWARAREVQTRTVAEVPHTAQVVTVDLGGPLHPKNKQAFARRLLRPVLALEYGWSVDYLNPTFESMERRDEKLVLTFKDTGGGLVVHGVWSIVLGFTVAGSNREFAIAEARVVGDNRVEVWSKDVPEPVAVRYAWSNNPRSNLFTKEGLPVTPFRTDDWDEPVTPEEAKGDEQ